MVKESFLDKFDPLFREKVGEVFGDNLVFGFVFGSIAKEIAGEFSDIDSFICIRKRNKEQEDTYVKWMADQHALHGLMVDYDYPAEIMTIEELDKITTVIPALELSLSKNSAEIYDAVLWTQVLSDKKSCRVGNLSRLKLFEDQCSGFPEIWRAQVLERMHQIGVEGLDHIKYQNPLYVLKNFVSWDHVSNGLLNRKPEGIAKGITAPNAAKP